MQNEPVCEKCREVFSSHTIVIENFPLNCCIPCIDKASEKRRMKERSLEKRRKARLGLR